jgi:hydrogenase/urease accessory protein HupE
MKKSVLQLFVPASCVLAPVSAWAHMGAHGMMGFVSGFNHPMSGADQHRKAMRLAGGAITLGGICLGIG